MGLKTVSWNRFSKNLRVSTRWKTPVKPWFFFNRGFFRGDSVPRFFHERTSTCRGPRCLRQPGRSPRVHAVEPVTGTDPLPARNRARFDILGGPHCRNPSEPSRPFRRRVILLITVLTICSPPPLAGAHPPRPPESPNHGNSIVSRTPVCFCSR